MNDYEFRKTEAILYGHYDNLRQVELLKDRINFIVEDIKVFRETIQEEGRYQVAHYGSERTTGSSTIYKAPQETVYLQMEDYISNLEKQRFEMMCKISGFNQQITILNHALGQLDHLEQKVVKCIYGEKLSMRQTAMSLDYASHNSIRRIRERVVEQVSSFIQGQESYQETKIV